MVFFLPVCISVHHMHGVPSDLKLESWMDVRVALGPGPFGRAANFFTIKLSLQPQFLYNF